MSSGDVIRVGSCTCLSNPQSENEPEVKTLRFAILIIFGIGALIIAGIGAGYFSHLGQVSSTIMIVIGGSAGVTLLVIGIIGYINKYKSNEKISVQDTNPYIPEESKDEQQRAEELEATRQREEQEKAEEKGKEVELEARKLEEVKKAQELEIIRQQEVLKREAELEAKTQREEQEKAEKKAKEAELKARKLEEEKKAQELEIIRQQEALKRQAELEAKIQREKQEQEARVEAEKKAKEAELKARELEEKIRAQVREIIRQQEEVKRKAELEAKVEEQKKVAELESKKQREEQDKAEKQAREEELKAKKLEEAKKAQEIETIRQQEILKRQAELEAKKNQEQQRAAELEAQRHREEQERINRIIAEKTAKEEAFKALSKSDKIEKLKEGLKTHKPHLSSYYEPTNHCPSSDLPYAHFTMPLQVGDLFFDVEPIGLVSKKSKEGQWDTILSFRYQGQRFEIFITTHWYLEDITGNFRIFAPQAFETAFQKWHSNFEIWNTNNREQKRYLTYDNLVLIDEMHLQDDAVVIDAVNIEFTAEYTKYVFYLPDYVDHGFAENRQFLKITRSLPSCLIDVEQLAYISEERRLKIHTQTCLIALPKGFSDSSKFSYDKETQCLALVISK